MESEEQRAWSLSPSVQHHASKKDSTGGPTQMKAPSHFCCSPVVLRES